MKKLILLILFSFSLFVSSCASEELQEIKNQSPQVLIIAHRGASGHRPEETLSAYELAIDLGADYIEMDLVSTQDGVLIARHENEISKTTDVEKKFPDRKKTKEIDGEKITGWFTEDFSLAEIKSLRAIERLPGRDHSYDGQFEIPTFEEILAFVRIQEKKKARQIGIYPETKHPSYFSHLGLPLEEKLVQLLNKYGFKNKNDLVYIQSFEALSLKKIKEISSFKLIKLISDPQLVTKTNLKKIKTYADGIGPNKLILLKSPEVVQNAHQEGLLVHPYTFRNDAPFLDSKYKGDPLNEYFEYFSLGIDGVFTDFTETAIRAREKFGSNKSF